MKKILLLTLSLLLLNILPTHAEQEVDLSTLDIKSQNFILVDQGTGKILSSKNHDIKVHPASITKILTMITGLELLEGTDLETVISIPKLVFDGIPQIASIAQLNPDDKMSLNEILYGIAMPSGADAARALSYHITGSVEGLTGKMNEMASKLGMSNTHFENTTGLDDPNHLTTLEDLAILLEYSFQNEDFKRYYTDSSFITRPTRMHPNGITYQNRQILEANALGFEHFVGAKSGTTELAERSLSSIASKDDMVLIFISTNAPMKGYALAPLTDAITVYNHTFDNYQRTILLQKDIDNIEIKVNGLKETIKVNPKQDVVEYLPKSVNREDIKLEITQDVKWTRLSVKKDTKIANIKYTLNEEVLYEQDIIAQEDLKVSLLTLSTNILGVFIFILLIAFIILKIRQTILRKNSRRNFKQGWRSR